MHYSARSTAQIPMFWGAAHCKGHTSPAAASPWLQELFGAFLTLRDVPSPAAAKSTMNKVWHGLQISLAAHNPPWVMEVLLVVGFAIWRLGY